MTEAFADVTVRRVGRPALAWTEGRTFRLPQSIVARSRLDRLRVSGGIDVPAEFDGIAPADVQLVRELAAFTDTPPASARVPISYQRVPGGARAVVASIVGRWQRRRASAWARFPRWPIDLSADFAADLASDRPVDARSPTPVIVTHDIDSPEGLRRLVADFLPCEEAVGARSTSYIVPCAWPVDAGLAREVCARGHHVGVHGYDHGNRTPFADAAERARRVEAGRAFGDTYGSRGYRAPSLLRTRALLQELRGRYAYDSSIPTSGGPFPVPNNGCATARPFTIEGIAEIPVSMPRDGSLRFLGYDARAILELWIACAAAIADAGGVVVLLTHCERRFSGNAPMLDTYVRFIDYVARAGRFRFATPDDVLERRAG